jgi:hypothetical protein
MKFTTKSFAAIAAVVLLLALPVVISAAAPSVRIDPGGTAADGHRSEWNVTPRDSSNSDWFSVTCTGDGGGGTSCDGNERGDLFLRYNCDTNSLYVLMYADREYAYTPGDPVNNWIKMANAKGNVVIKVSYDGAPNWFNLPAPANEGFEVLLTQDGVGAPLVDGASYAINFHSFMGGVTSGTGETTVTLPSCDPTAVSLQTLSASTNGGRSSLPGLPLFGVGIASLAAVVVIRRPRK